MAKQQPSQMLSSYGSAALQLLVQKKLQARIKEILEDYELNLTQWLIICRLNDIKDGLRTTDLARFMHVEVPLVTMMSRPLRRRGLITSAVNKPDKREKVLCVTSEAEHLISDVEKRLQPQLEDMAEGLTLQDLQTYFKVLQRMLANPAT